MTKTASALRLAAVTGAASAALLALSPAAAQESGGGHTVTIGLGAQAMPQYPGANSYSIYPMPIFGFRREGAPMPFIAQDQGVGFGFLGQDSRFNVGPSFRLRAKRQEQDVGARVGDVGFTIEAGGFVELYPARSLRLRGDVRQGLTGHKGLVGDLSADLIIRDEQTYIFSIGPRARWGDRDFTRAYFGVTPAAALTSGLPAFQPRSGFYSAGVMAGLTYRLGGNWGMRAYAGYDRLINDAADSPIVHNFGSRDQFSGGAGLFLEFNVGGHRR
ncbi:MAG: MipA/OmpV family protein [Sphingomonadaceae bacterium]|nr:MipA/OmpV family protein [Sphingomonadaceae bacterium]